MKAFTSPIIFTNSFYIITKVKNKSKAWAALKKIRLLFNVSNVTEKIVDLALASDFLDFEDAIQYYAALEQKVDYIVIRNKKHFISKQVPIITPAEYVALINTNN